MEMTAYYKSVLDADAAPIVLCDLNHTIIYMNRSAVLRYAARGGEKLLGMSLLLCHPPQAKELICRCLSWFSESPEHNVVYEFRNDEENKDVYMIALRDDDGKLIGYYEKHEYRNRETAKLYDFY